MANKRKITTAIVAGVTAVALLLGGTFAWQSINQTALNEASAVINPGGRLHDDFNGSNKDVYVENFADESIFARIRLDEYFEIIMNKGVTGAETVDYVAGTKDEDGNIISWATHKFDGSDATKDYWEWTTGGSTIYMPTFNMNKDSLEADINGTLQGEDGVVKDEMPDDRYSDYKEYANGETVEGTEIYDADTNQNDEVGEDFGSLENYVTAGNITTVGNVTHTAKETLGATLISMDEWMTAYNSEPGEYWVYDTDGWVYWAQAIQPGTATGLLLSGIALTKVMDDSWYYAINVVAQFITADDLGREDGTGFYDTTNGTVPSDNALALLDKIGVEVNGEAGDDEPADPEEPTDPDAPAAVYAITAAAGNDSTTYNGNFVDGGVYALTMTKDDEALENVTWSMELVEGGPVESNNTLGATSIDSSTGLLTVAADEAGTTYHIVKVTATAEDGTTADQKFIICNTVSIDPKVVNADGTEITGYIVAGTTYKLILNLYVEVDGTGYGLANYVDATLNSENTTFALFVADSGFVTTDAVTMNDDGTFTASRAGTYQYTYNAGGFSGSNMFTVVKDNKTLTITPRAEQAGEAVDLARESPFLAVVIGYDGTLDVSNPGNFTAEVSVNGTPEKADFFAGGTEGNYGGTIYFIPLQDILSTGTYDVKVTYEDDSVIATGTIQVDLILNTVTLSADSSAETIEMTGEDTMVLALDDGTRFVDLFDGPYTADTWVDAVYSDLQALVSLTSGDATGTWAMIEPGTAANGNPWYKYKVTLESLHQSYYFIVVMDENYDVRWIYALPESTGDATITVTVDGTAYTADVQVNAVG